MSQSPLETLHAAVSAIESRNVEALMPLIDEECTISLEKNIVFADGRDAIRDYYTSLFDGDPDFRVEIGEHFTVGTVLMTQETLITVVDGEEKPSSQAWAYQVRDGKFILMHMFDPNGEMEELISNLAHE
jgi:hypothetical protein